MSDELRNFATRPHLVSTPQSERADERQVPNSAGGYTFQVSDWDRLTRFLILGTSGGTYYVSGRKLTEDNASALMALVEKDPQRYVDTVREISLAGRAPKNDPALFALALAAAAKDPQARALAFAALTDVARIGTHLFTFVEILQNHRGWGRGARRGVARWYEDREPGALAYQMVKYRSRNGWSHRDVLRLTHPKAPTSTHKMLYDFVSDRIDAEHRESLSYNSDAASHIVGSFFDVQAGINLQEIAQSGVLPWEAFPPESLDAGVWKALIKTGALPVGAMVRQLPTLTRAGVLDDPESLSKVLTTLSEGEVLRKARMHPLSLLVAQRTYAKGEGRGGRDWTPKPRVIDALNDAFYLAFGAVEPTGKRIMLALDVSGSMGFGNIAGMPITPREATAALALVTANVEDNYTIVGFTTAGGTHSRIHGADNGISPLNISPRQRLDDAINVVSGLPFGGTDVALPLVYAMENDLAIDAFIVLSDNESWAGPVHVHEALRQYRHKSGIDAKMVVVGMTATEYSVLDPSDLGSLNVVGFDVASPQVISDFIRG